MKAPIIFALACAIAAAAHAADPTLTPANGYPKFALGADVSWTPYIEQNKTCAYYKSANTSADQLTNVAEMVTDHGIDAVRLRVWVNPKAKMAMSGFSYKAWNSSYTSMSTFGTCSVEEMTTLARRFAAQGQRVMVVFQMSDQWTDPGSQFIPESWAGCASADQLAAKAAEHVSEVLNILYDNNVNVAWVQIGNETNSGMLAWELPANNGDAVKTAAYGCLLEASGNVPAQTAYNFAKVFNACADAAKQIYPQTKTVLHLANADKWSALNWVLNLLNKAGVTKAKCDYIGLSLYPGLSDGQTDYTAKWKTYADLAISSIKSIYSSYGFRTLLAEIGMNNEYSLSADVSNVSAANRQAAYIQQCNTDVKAFTQYLIDQLAPAQSTCDGLFYWEPETDYIKDYTRGACVSATPGASWPRDKVVANAWWTAVKENSTFPDGGLVPYDNASNSLGSAAANTDSDPSYYNLQGMPVKMPMRSGVYIKRQGASSQKVYIP